MEAHDTVKSRIRLVPDTSRVCEKKKGTRYKKKAS